MLGGSLGVCPAEGSLLELKGPLGAALVRLSCMEMASVREDGIELPAPEMDACTSFWEQILSIRCETQFVLSGVALLGAVTGSMTLRQLWQAGRLDTHFVGPASFFVATLGVILSVHGTLASMLVLGGNMLFLMSLWRARNVKLVGPRLRARLVVPIAD